MTDFEEEIKKVEEGVDLVIDFIGRSYFNQNLNILRRDGTLVFLAMMSGPKLEPDTNIIQILFKRLTIKGSTLRSRTVDYQAELLEKFEKEALGLITDGKMKVEVHKVYDWKDVVEAQKEMEGNKNSGKVSHFPPAVYLHQAIWLLVRVAVSFLKLTGRSCSKYRNRFYMHNP